MSTWNRETQEISNHLQSVWMAIQAALERFTASADVRPANSPFDCSVREGRNQVGIGPIVFRLPERFSHLEQTLYVVLKGFITFEPGFGQLKATYEFGSQVGYFRVEEDKDLMAHVYGVHYDMDLNAMHPVFHAQLGSQVELAASVKELFNVDWPVRNDTEHLLRNVRTPTAQMDVFSVITQVAADHLATAQSSEDDIRAFESLREACDFLVGAGARFGHLNGAKPANCYRSTHWYARDAAEA